MPKNCSNASISEAKASTVSLIRRAAALLYDGLILFAIMLLFTGVVIIIRHDKAIPPESLWFQGILIAICLIYFCYFWIRYGQTLGMLAWKIKLSQKNGNPIHFKQAIFRFFLACLSLLVFALGFIFCLFNKEKLTLHDKLLGTRTYFYDI
ncbi:MAG: RDD family protein [Pseudomonadota bacterium]